MIIQIRPVLLVVRLTRLMRDVFFPSVYDALFLIRPSCNFRDGRVIKNDTVNFRQYFIELAFNDSYLLALIHLIPANYHLIIDTLYPEISKEVHDINLRDILLGFAAVFLLIKSYASCFVAEASQLCYKALLRTIALGSTEGLCTWRSSILLGLQPLIVPVGTITLGRIFNVVGCIIDPYCEFSLSIQFNTTIGITSGLFVSSDENKTYSSSYPNHIRIFV